MKPTIFLFLGPGDTMRYARARKASLRARIKKLFSPTENCYTYKGFPIPSPTMTDRFIKVLRQPLALITLAAAALCLSACCQTAISAQHAQAIHQALQQVETQNKQIRQAIADGEYITVDYRDGVHRFIDGTGMYPSCDFLPPRHKVAFVYFRGLATDETIEKTLKEMKTHGLDVPYIIRDHNGLGPIVEHVRHTRSSGMSQQPFLSLDD